MLARSLWLPGLAAASLACIPSAVAQETRPAPVMRDIPMGVPDAPVTIVEYASVTCAACQHFHTDILPRLKARYILSGEARYILRDHPTPPAPVSFAGFALARCAGESEFYGVIGDFFAKQTDILTAARGGNARPFIVQIGAAHGLSEPQVEACIRDPKLEAYIQKQLDDAPDMTSTPAVFVNDKRVAGFTYEAIARAIDEAIEAAKPAAPSPESPPESPATPAPEDPPASAPLPLPPAAEPLAFGPTTPPRPN
jgi:protein-disulfide isomerase